MASIAASKRKRTRYVKGHSNRSLLCKLVHCHLTDDKSKLNKNNVVLYNTCIIIINR